MTTPPAPRLDRAQLERVLLRAAELQATERELADGLTPDEVVALAREVGIPEGHVRRALVESRHAPVAAPPAGLLDGLMGRAQLVASRVVPGEPAVVEQALLGWMAEHEVLAVQRRVPGRIVWEPQGGLQAALKRSGVVVRSGGRTFMLTRAGEVSAEIVAVEAGWSQVTLRADAARRRAGFGIGAGVMTTTGAIASGILAALHAPLLIAAIPGAVLAGASVVVLRAFRPTSARLEVGLDRALDFLEHHRPDRTLPPPREGLLGVLADELKRALR